MILVSIILLRCVTLELLRSICLQEPGLLPQTSDDGVCSNIKKDISSQWIKEVTVSYCELRGDPALLLVKQK